MKEEPLHPWIEPEIEARIVALVLGESSDFEKEELERLIEEKSELAMFKKRIETMHGLLRDVATGESAADDDDWKLSDDKRNSVLAVIDGKKEVKLKETVIKKPVVKKKSSNGKFFQRFVEMAAVLFIGALLWGMAMPAFKKTYSSSPRSRSSKMAYTDKSESSSNYSYDQASSPPTADAASVAKPDPQANSRSSLSSIQQNLSLVSNSADSTSESIEFAPDGSRETRWASSSGDGYLDANGMVDQSKILSRYEVPMDGKAKLSFPNNAGQASDPFATPVDRESVAITTSRPSLAAQNGGFDISANLAGLGVGGMAAGEGEASASANKDIAGLTDSKTSSMRRNFTIDEVKQRDSRGMQQAGVAGDNVEVSSLDIDDDGLLRTENKRVAGSLRNDLPSPAAKESRDTNHNFATVMPAKPISGMIIDESKKDISKSRNLGEKAQAARGQFGISDAAPRPGQPVIAGRNLDAVKKEAGKDFDGLALTAPRKTPATLTAAPMPSGEVLERKRKLKGADVEMERLAESEADFKKSDRSLTASTTRDQNRGGQVLNETAIQNKETVSGRAFRNTLSPAVEVPVEEIEINGRMASQRKIQDISKQQANTKLKTDLQSAPHVTARSGARLKTEAIREFVVPNRSDAPEIPKDVADKMARLSPKTIVGGGAVAGKPMDPMEAIADNEEEGFYIRGAQFNDVFQFLAKSSNLNYFHNPDLGEPKYVVDGNHLSETDPLKQMQELGLMYGISVSQKGNTVYAKSEGRLPQLPAGTVPLGVGKKGSKDSLFVAGDSKKELKGKIGNGTPLRQTKINDALQFLARKAGLKYTPNTLLSSPNYVVNGIIQEGAPLDQLADLGSNYGITLHKKEGVLYAMTKEQAAQPPVKMVTLHAGTKTHKKSNPSIDSLVSTTNSINGNTKDGLFIRNAQLNDVLQFLAKSAGVNYFHNPELADERYKVTGHLQSGDPLSQMEELAYMYGVTFLQDGSTIKALKAPEQKAAPPVGINEKNAEEESFSTFSLHVSDVSFKLAQAALAKGEWPDASKVRIEEFVNAFDYGDPMPNQNEKVACRVEQAIHPFLQQRNLMRVSMRTAAEGRSGSTPLRLTFLLDNSGSMERSDRQETVQRAFALLAQQLKPMDQVTLISFARQPRLLADKVSGAKSKALVQLVANIPSEGGTNLEAALQLAFEKAREQQVDNAQNRIIMLTDGAANLGDAKPENLARMIEKMRDSGIAFDAAGIGADGLNDEILEALTRKGDGRYYLLDQPEDADDGFARQIAGALRPAAKNVKVQIEFNPDRVGKYKLLGFEKHRLKKEDFRNDKVDAAEMAAAEAGVAVYQFETKADGKGDVGSVSVRFRDMSSGLMVENRWPIPYEADAPRPEQAAPSLRIATSAALLGAKLKGGPLGGSVDLKTLSNLIAGLPDRHRKAKRVQQLQQMINQARQVSGK